MASESASGDRPPLTEEHVIARGGWHPRYARTIAIATDGDYGLVLVDGNGDGAELEVEFWTFSDGTWVGGSSSGAGPVGHIRALTTWWPVEHACFAFGRAPGRSSVTVSFAGQRHDIPVGRASLWAFVKVPSDANRSATPALLD